MSLLVSFFFSSKECIPSFALYFLLNIECISLLADEEDAINRQKRGGSGSGSGGSKWRRITDDDDNNTGSKEGAGASGGGSGGPEDGGDTPKRPTDREKTPELVRTTRGGGRSTKKK